LQPKDQTGYHTLQIIAGADQFNKWTYERIRPFLKGKILEIGSGLGNISKYAIADRRHITLSDVDREYILFLERVYGQNPQVLSILRLDVGKSDFSAEYRDLAGSFDSLFILNVIEHVQDDGLALQNCRFLLKTGGILVILVPAYPFLFSAMDRGLGHFRRYTRHSLAARVREQGLTILQNSYFNTLGVLGWFFSGRILRSKSIQAPEMKTFNKLVPLARFTDKLFRQSFGLSVITIAKK